MAKGVSIHIGLNGVDPEHYHDRLGRPWPGTLVACEADALAMQALAQAQGFASTLLLTAQATSQAVVDAITQAAQVLEGGDMLLLTYSGHGGQVPDTNGDEVPPADGLDETWCLYDRQVVDDELYRLWGLFAAGVRIMMLSDSCHSGTVARDPEVAKATQETGLLPRTLPSDVQERTYQTHKKLYDGIQEKAAGRTGADVKASVLLISGCQDDQVSRDGEKNGLFTGTLLKVWNHGRFKGDVARFWQRIVDRMPEDQTPNLFNTGAPDPQFEHLHPFTI